MIEFNIKSLRTKVTENHIRIGIAIAAAAIGYGVRVYQEKQRLVDVEEAYLNFASEDLTTPEETNNQVKLVSIQEESEKTALDEDDVSINHTWNHPSMGSRVEEVTSKLEEDEDWDWDKELAERSERHPYILHVDEFYANEKDYTQTTLTYFSGDDILIDQDEVPIYSHTKTTGPLLFGHGSKDPNVVYIRNDKYQSEYEVLYDPDSYAHFILGLEMEVDPHQKPRRPTPIDE